MTNKTVQRVHRAEELRPQRMHVEVTVFGLSEGMTRRQYFFLSSKKVRNQSGGRPRGVMRTQSKVLLAVVPAIALLVGCTSETSRVVDASSEISTPPEGCERTWCDAEYDECKLAQRDYCSECMQKCGEIVYTTPGYTSSCLSTCNRICQTPRTDSCWSSKETCRRTRKNAACVEGISSRNLPIPSRSTHLEWTRPRPAHAGKCTVQEAINIMAGCLSVNGACEDMIRRQRDCGACMLSSIEDAAWGPFVTHSEGFFVNDWGCIAAIDGDQSEGGCAQTLMRRDACMKACDQAKDRGECEAFAAVHVCSQEVTAATTCEESARTDPRFAACSRGSTKIHVYLDLALFFCGSL